MIGQGGDLDAICPPLQLSQSENALSLLIKIHAFSWMVERGSEEVSHTAASTQHRLLYAYNNIKIY